MTYQDHGRINRDSKLYLLQEKMPAVVLAGDRNTIPLYPGYRPGPKALLRYAGKTSLEYVLDALVNVASIKEICVVGSGRDLRGALQAVEGGVLIPGEGTMAEGILKGLDHFRDSQSVLFVTADLPLLTHGAVNHFLKKVSSTPVKTDRAFFFSFVPRPFFRGPYRETSKGFIRFKDVSVCFGNLMVLLPGLLKNPKLRITLKKMYRTRKSAAKAAMAMDPLLGTVFFFCVYLFHGFTLSRGARLASRRLDVEVVPIPVEEPEICLDVDEPEDHLLVKRILEERAGVLGGP
ncbi:MAG: nucleotidyltransferase family protein [Desulfatiglandales bacterium]